GSVSYNDHVYMREIVKGIVDSEYDIYNYSFLDYNGKYFYPGTTEPVLTPRKNFKIIKGNHNVGMGFFELPITIIDEAGISYKFGMDDEELYAVVEESITYPYNPMNFMLTEIISADKSDTVKFKYTHLTA